MELSTGCRTGSTLQCAMRHRPEWLHCVCAGAEEGGKQSEDGAPREVLAAYDQLWQVVKLPALRKFAVILLTFR